MWCQKTMSLPSRTLYKTVMVAGYDFSCAFDTMGTRELVAKLREMDVDKKAVLWFKDYLSGRHQRFRYRVDSSTLRLVSYGVPQGRPLRSSLPWPTTFAGSWELTGRAATTASQFTLRRRHRHLDSEQGPQGCKGEAGEVLGKAAIVCPGQLPCTQGLKNPTRCCWNPSCPSYPSRWSSSATTRWAAAAWG